MTSRDFCYWLQGYIEITESGDNSTTLTEEQTECIRKHLALVFKHEIDPTFGPAEKQAELSKIHQQPAGGIGGVISGGIGKDTLIRC